MNENKKELKLPTKIRLFTGAETFKGVFNLQKRVNDFLASVEVLDIQYGIGLDGITIMVSYKEVPIDD